VKGAYTSSIGYPAPKRWRRLKSWKELPRCDRVRVLWPKRDSLDSKAPVGFVTQWNPVVARAADPEVRPELFEWREGQNLGDRKVELDGGSVVDLPSLAGFEGWL
jgi:hypothetical protein